MRADQLFDALPMAVVFLSSDGITRRLNQAARAQLGDLAPNEDIFPRLSASGYDDQAIATALRTGSGTAEAWHVSALDDGNRLLTLLLSGPEIRRRERLGRIEEVFDTIEDGILLLDPFGTLVLANHAMQQNMATVGLSLQEGMAYHDIVLYRLNLEDQLPQAERDAAARQVARMMMQRCRKGEQTKFDLAGNIVEVAHLMVDDHYLMVYHSVTERENQARELRAAMERYRRVIEDQTEMICRYDKDLVLTFANPPYESAFSTDGSTVVGHRVPDLIHEPEARDKIVSGVLALTPENPILQDTYFEPDPDGAPRWMTWANRALFDEAGTLIEYQAVGRDVTRERLAQDALDRQNAALAQSEKMAAMGSLLASVSHELNNPLSIVLGQSELLESLAEDDATLQRAQRIKSAAERCGRIVRTFLAMARQREMERAPVNLAQTVETAQGMASYAFSASGIDLTVRLPDTPLYVLGDGDQLVQVFVNMLLNAQQAMEDVDGPRAVAIDGTCDGTRLAISVTDSGPGVPPDLIDQIFEPFFTTKSEGVGTGIGLSLCRNIVETHGGTLTCANAPDRGAVFTIDLPLAEPFDVATPGALDDQWGHLPPLNILLVDDEPEVAQVSAEFLQADGHTVKFANDGEEALTAIEEQDFDVVLSDIRMPGLDGPGLWRALEQSGAFPVERIGFLTGDTLGGSVRGFLETHPAEVLNKPFHRDELRRLILRLLSVEI